MPRSRLGVALLLAPPLAAEVDGLRRALGDGALGRIPPHLTLVPPVNVAADRLDDALRVLREAAAATRPFTVVLGPPATFLPDSPVVHLPVAGDAAAVADLRGRVFRPPLARSLTWPFVPHVTLADGAPAERIAAALVALHDYRVEATFSRVHLLEEGKGRVWEPVADAPFAAPAVVGRGGLPLELTVTSRPDVAGRALLDGERRACEAELGVPERASFALTARREGDVVGVAEGWTAGGTGFLSGLVVAPPYRGQGVGSKLLAAFESLAAERDCHRLAVVAFAATRGEAFYRAKGWKEEARVTEWVGGRDLVQLRRDL